METATEVLSGVYRIELPLPFELESVNVFLAPLADGYLLIDCGMETNLSFAALESGLRQIGVRWTDIRQIFLTHMHPDHMGLSARLLELTGAELLMHQAEADHLRLVARGGQRVAWMSRAFAQAGVPEALQSKMDAHFVQIRKNFHDLTPDRVFAGGEEIDTALGPLRVCWTPGHSPGHACLYNANRKALFSGDLILEHITPNISWHPGEDTLADFLASLEGMVDLEIDIILPSHGAPFAGHRAWIAQTIHHHQERCDEIFGLVRGDPQTAYDLVSQLWRRQLSPINHQFAIFEVMAHLEHMQRQGRIGARDRQGALEWHG